jgi:hypothetical protein
MAQIQLSAGDLRKLAQMLDTMVETNMATGVLFGTVQGTDVEMPGWGFPLKVKRITVPRPPNHPLAATQAAADNPPTIDVYGIVIDTSEF